MIFNPWKKKVQYLWLNVSHCLDFTPIIDGTAIQQKLVLKQVFVNYKQSCVNPNYKGQFKSRSKKKSTWD